MLNAKGEVAEAASANLFRIRDGTVLTPPPSVGILPGVTREVVVELCRLLGIPHGEAAIHPDALLATDAVFLTLSTFGIVEVRSLDGRPFGISPLVATIRRAYWERVERQTGR